MHTDSPASPDQRIWWLERPGDDFPYCRGDPVRISGRQWWIVMAAVVIGYAVLILPPPGFRGPVSSFVPAILFSAIPLAVLAFVAGGAWKALFRRLRGRDFLWMIAFAVLNFVVAIIAGNIIAMLVETTANEAVASTGNLEGGEQLLLFARSGVQLFGEEVMSILPFLALMYWLVSVRGMGRTGAIVIATLVVALLFAAVHLPTYGWNVIQVVLGVGVARIVLLIPYLMTKNILVSTGAHILNDWISFTLAILAAATASG
jgi:hypothetical protein